MTSVFGRGLRCTPTDFVSKLTVHRLCHTNLKIAVFQTISISRNYDITCRWTWQSSQWLGHTGSAWGVSAVREEKRQRLHPSQRPVTRARRRHTCYLRPEPLLSHSPWTTPQLTNIHTLSFCLRQNLNLNKSSKSQSWIKC